MIYERKEFTLKNGLKITVRSPEKEDAKELLDFIIKIAGQTPFLLSTPEDFQSVTVESETGFIESYLNNKNYLLIVCLDGKIIGDCNINMNSHVKDRHRCKLGIGIDALYCEMGIGSLLFDEMIQIARKTEGIEIMELGVNSTNYRAQHLYAKKGFIPTGSIPKALRDANGHYSDEILMSKFLSDVDIANIVGKDYFGCFNKERNASRCIILNEGKVLLAYSKTDDIYMLPGGGREEPEDDWQCCIREVKEETGLVIEPSQCILEINEYYENERYIDRYYFGTVVGNTELNLTQQEKAAGLTCKWVDIDQALEIFSHHDDYAETKEEKRGIYLREYTALKKHFKEY